MNDLPTGSGLKFPQEARIKQRWEFEKNRVDGARLVSGSLIANWRINPQQSRARLGVITSKKVGGAVIRSRARRLLREVFRLHQAHLKPVDLILIARPSLANKSMSQVEKNYIVLIKQAGLFVP